MKKLTTLFLGLFAAATLFAAPFAQWFELTAPNGQSIRVYGEGDDYSAWFEAEDGHAVWYNADLGGYEYMRKLPDGSLAGTGILVGAEAGHEAELAAIPLHERDTSDVHGQNIEKRILEKEERMELKARWKSLKENAAARREAAKMARQGVFLGAPSSPTTGNIVGCTLLVDFPLDESGNGSLWAQQSASVTAEKVDAYLNGEGPDSFGNACSVRQYYYEVSKGRLRYSNVVLGPVKVPHPRSYYDRTGDPETDCARDLIADAVAAMKASSDFSSKYRPLLQQVTVRNGKVLALNILFAGGESPVWSKGLWAHCSGLLNTISTGASGAFYNYQISPCTSAPSLYVFCHENGHMVCDFPDFYSYGDMSHNLVGTRCLMADRTNARNPGAISAYLRYCAGWVDPQTLPDNAVVSVTRDYGDVYIFENGNREEEYYLIENRGGGRDNNINGTGIIIWHCNEKGNNKNVKAWNAAFSDATDNTKYRLSNIELTMEQADGMYHMERSQGYDGRDFWYSGNDAAGYTGEFSDFTVPTARWMDGTASGLVLSEFSANASTMTFVVGNPVEEGAPTISEEITASSYVGTAKLTVSNFGTGASSADVFVEMFAEATRKTLVGSVQVADGLATTGQRTYAFPLVNGLAPQYVRLRVVNDKGKTAYGDLVLVTNGKAGASSGGWGESGGNDFGAAVDAPSLVVSSTSSGAEWTKVTGTSDYMTAPACLRFYGAASTTSPKTATLTATVAGPGTFTFYASSKLTMNGDTKDKTLGNPQCSVAFTAKGPGGNTIGTKTINCTSTTKTAFQAYSVNLESGNNTLTWVGSWQDPVSGTWNVGNVYIDKFLLDKTVAASMPVATIAAGSLQPTSANVSVTVTDRADEASVTVSSITVSANKDYSDPVYTGAPGAVSGLAPLTRYYVQATLAGSSGATYPAIGSFATPDWTKPTGSISVSNVKHFSATVDVNVTNPGSEAAGDIVKSVMVARDASFSQILKDRVPVPCDLENLEAGTTYYVRGVLTGPLTGETDIDSTFTTLSASVPVIGAVSQASVGTDAVSVNVTVANFGDGSTGGTVLVEAVAGNEVAASASGTASGTYALTGLTRNTTYAIRVTVTGSNGLSATDESLTVTTLNVPVILADPAAAVGAAGMSATMSARVAFRESTVSDSNAKLYLAEAGGSETLVKTWNSFAQGDTLSFSAETEPNTDYAYRFVATTAWQSLNWSTEVTGDFRTEYYVTNAWLSVDFEDYTTGANWDATPDAGGTWTKTVGGVYESSSEVVDFSSEFGKGLGLDQTGESTTAKYTASAARPDGIRCLFDADMYFTVCKVPPASLTSEVLATATTAIFLYSGDEANNFRVYTADGWVDVFADGFVPANKTFHHVTADIDYDVTPARVRFTVDGHVLADANDATWFNRANASQTAKLTAVSVYGNSKLDGFSAQMLEYANEACAHEHTVTNGAVAATCTTAGSTGTITCDDCDRVWPAVEIPALGHLWGDWAVTQEATTTSAGTKRRECLRDGCDAFETEEIPMLDAVVALRNVAVVTTVGTVPTLPAKVAGLKADGTVDGEYDVVWESTAAPSEAGLTFVNGTATVNGAPMGVTASVRAAVASSGGGSGELVNIAPLASSMTVTPIPAKSPEAQNQSAITNGWAGSDMALGQWRTPAHNSHRYFWTAADQGTIKVDFAWPTTRRISAVGIAVYDGNQHGTAALKYASTGEEIESSKYVYANNGNNYYKINQGDAHYYAFKEPIALSELTVEVTKKSSNSWIGLYQIEIFAEDSGPEEPVEPTTTDTLTALAVDGAPVPDFAATTYAYTVENGTAITLATNDTDNVAVTILPKFNDSAYVVTLAEDGESTQKYTVALPEVYICEHEHTHLVNAVEATCEEAGYTGDTYCDDCNQTIATGSVITALGHLWSDWTVTQEPTTTSTGTKHRECLREGCNAEENEEIPMLVDVVALRNVAVVTAVGTVPTLPEKVAGLKANGGVNGEYDVVWETAAAPSAEGITIVNGTATINGAPMGVTASVRAVVASSGGGSGELVNIAQSASAMTLTCSNGTIPDDISAITNGWGATMTIGGWNTPGNGWNTWPKDTSAPLTLTVDFSWSEPKSITKIFVASWDDNQHATITLKDGSTGTGLGGYTYTQDGNAYYKINQGDGNLYVFSTPVVLSQLRVESAKTAGARYVGFYEIEVWAEESGSGGTVEPTTTDTLTALEVDDVAVTDFAATTYAYEVANGEAITLAENDTDNVGITILPKFEGAAYVVTLAEDGESTQTYTVAMPDATPQATVVIIARNGDETAVDLPLDGLDAALDALVADAGYGSTVMLPALDENCTITLAPGVTVVKNADSTGVVTLVVPEAKSDWYELNADGNAMVLSEGARPVITGIEATDGESVLTVGNVKPGLYYAVVQAATLDGWDDATVVATSDMIESGDTYTFTVPQEDGENAAFYRVIATDDPSVGG